MRPSISFTSEDAIKAINSYFVENGYKNEDHKILVNYISNVLYSLHTIYDSSQPKYVCTYCDIFFLINDLLQDTQSIDAIGLIYFDGLIDKLNAFEERRRNQFDLATIRAFHTKASIILISLIDFFEHGMHALKCYPEYAEKRSLYITQLKKPLEIIGLSIDNPSKLFATISKFYEEQSLQDRIPLLQPIYAAKAAHFSQLEKSDNVITPILTEQLSPPPPAEKKLDESNDGFFATFLRKFSFGSKSHATNDNNPEKENLLKKTN